MVFPRHFPAAEAKVLMRFGGDTNLALWNPESHHVRAPTG
jgi:hypothetical protein